MNAPAQAVQWRVHTPRLLQEIGINKEMAILKVPLNIFARLLGQVAARAIELDDEELNKLMMRLTLYDQADPMAEGYDPALVDQLLGGMEIVP